MADGLSHDFGRSRSESLSTAPVGAKKAMFSDLGKPAAAPALTHTDESARGSKKWKQVSTTSATVGKFDRRRVFDKFAAGLPPYQSSRPINLIIPRRRGVLP